MPTPVAHVVAGVCLAGLAARRFPGARALPVALAAVAAANLPDLDYLALARGREAMERFHQGWVHSAAFVCAAALPLAATLRRRIGFRCAWLLLACAGLSHLALDLLAFDRKPPIGLPLLWPFTDARFHAPVTVFPGIDRVVIFGERNVRELVVELALGLPALLLVRPWRGQAAAIQRSPGGA